MSGDNHETHKGRTTSPRINCMHASPWLRNQGKWQKSAEPQPVMARLDMASLEHDRIGVHGEG